MSSVYEIITNKIIQELENGKIPWEQPWYGSKVNYETRKPYHGINLLLLKKMGEYLTFYQIKKYGGKVKKGATPYMVVFYKPFYVDTETKQIIENTENGQKYEIKYMLRYYYVYHLDDVEGIESKIKTVSKTPEMVLEEAEKIIKGYKNHPQILEDGDHAYYSPSLDVVVIPPRTIFKTPEGRYETLFHELVHSTGHPSRLNRFKDGAQNAAFGSVEYSKEELIAELGAAFLCSMTGIKKTFNNSVAYIQSWLQALKNDKKLVVTAAASAEKAVEYITGIRS